MNLRPCGWWFRNVQDVFVGRSNRMFVNESAVETVRTQAAAIEHACLVPYLVEVD